MCLREMGVGSGGMAGVRTLEIQVGAKFLPKMSNPSAQGLFSSIALMIFS